MKATVVFAAALLLSALSGCTERDATSSVEPNAAESSSSTAASAAPAPAAAQANPPAAVAEPEDPAGPPPSPAAAPAAAAAPECKESPMREEACKPNDTGDPAQKNTGAPPQNP